jgi:hypothetical protein
MGKRNISRGRVGPNNRDFPVDLDYYVWARKRRQAGDSGCDVRQGLPMKKTKQLNQRISKSLIAYAAMAGAGVAGCATRAAAEVVYTPIDRPIHSNYFVDLNHDGINDFQITSYEYSDEGEVQVFPMQGNRIVPTASATCGPRSYSMAAAPLPAGAVIGQGKPFQARANCMAFSLYGGNGPWFRTADRYLGFAFNIDGKEHFGWARMTVGRFIFNRTATITGYAYETVAGKPIVAGDEGNATKVFPQSGTLGALAAGAAQVLSGSLEEEGLKEDK